MMMISMMTTGVPAPGQPLVTSFFQQAGDDQAVKLYMNGLFVGTLQGQVKMTWPETTVGLLKQKIEPLSDPLAAMAVDIGAEGYFPACSGTDEASEAKILQKYAGYEVRSIFELLLAAGPVDDAEDGAEDEEDENESFPASSNG